MNRRGDISITILVIGIIVVCFLALASFAVTTSNTFEFFNGINLMEKVSARAERGDDFDGDVGGEEFWLERKMGKSAWHKFKADKVLFEVRYYSP